MGVKKYFTWRSCCWALSCCWSSNSFCIFSWVFCSCNNCSWYCCWRAGGRESCGSWGKCAVPLAKRAADGPFCSTWVCTALGFANGIHSLFEICRDHLSPRAVPNFIDRIKQTDIVSVRRLCTVWNRKNAIYVYGRGVLIYFFGPIECKSWLVYINVDWVTKQFKFALDEAEIECKFPERDCILSSYLANCL